MSDQLIPAIYLPVEAEEWIQLMKEDPVFEPLVRAAVLIGTMDSWGGGEDHQDAMANASIGVLLYAAALIANTHGISHDQTRYSLETAFMASFSTAETEFEMMIEDTPSDPDVVLN